MSSWGNVRSGKCLSGKMSSQGSVSRGTVHIPVMLPPMGFVACESKSNCTIFLTSLIKKRLFRDIPFNF